MNVSVFCLWEGQQPEFLFSHIRQVHAGGAEFPDLSPRPSLKGRGLVRLRNGFRVQDKFSVTVVLASPL